MFCYWELTSVSKLIDDFQFRRNIFDSFFLFGKNRFRRKLLSFALKFSRKICIVRFYSIHSLYNTLYRFILSKCAKNWVHYEILFLLHWEFTLIWPLKAVKKRFSLISAIISLSSVLTAIVLWHFQRCKWPTKKRTIPKNFIIQM